MGKLTSGSAINAGAPAGIGNRTALLFAQEGAVVVISSRCAKTVTVPLNLDCCAFAGDHGLLIPELTASATSLESAEENAHPYGGYYSSNITCEIGMSLATQHNYHSIIYLLEQASR